jgi:hypothetical protein
MLLSLVLGWMFDYTPPSFEQVPDIVVTGRPRIQVYNLPIYAKK